MRNPFQKERILSVHILTGKVKFILKDQVQIGEIFGKPFNRDNVSNILLGAQRMYHIRCGDKVYDIPEHAIEEVR